MGYSCSRLSNLSTWFTLPPSPSWRLRLRRSALAWPLLLRSGWLLPAGSGSGSGSGPPDDVPYNVGDDHDGAGASDPEGGGDGVPAPVRQFGDSNFGAGNGYGSGSDFSRGYLHATGILGDGSNLGNGSGVGW